MPTKIELAQRLKDQLDSVRYNPQARMVAYAWLALANGSLAKLGGFQGGMVADSLTPDVQILQGLADGFPDDDQEVDTALWAGPTGMRRAIQRVADGVWAQEAVFPEGLSWGDDAQDFAEGAGSALGDVWNKAKDLPKGLAPVIWPLALGALAILIVVIVVSRKVPA